MPGDKFLRAGNGRRSSAQFREAACQKAPLGLLSSECHCALIGDPRFAASTQPAAEVGPRGVGEVVVGKLAPREDGVDQLETGFWPIPHGHRDRTIELDDRGGLGPQRTS